MGSSIIEPIRPAWFNSSPDCDWREDFSHENGGYFNECLSCKSDFIGHKRRVFCRKCFHVAKERYEAMTPDEKQEHRDGIDRVLEEFYKDIPSNP